LKGASESLPCLGYGFWSCRACKRWQHSSGDFAPHKPLVLVSSLFVGSCSAAACVGIVGGCCAALGMATSQGALRELAVACDRPSCQSVCDDAKACALILKLWRTCLQLQWRTWEVARSTIHHALHCRSWRRARRLRSCAARGQATKCARQHRREAYVRQRV
jgi:hypothetical protein